MSAGREISVQQSEMISCSFFVHVCTYLSVCVLFLPALAVYPHPNISNQLLWKRQQFCPKIQNTQAVVQRKKFFWKASMHLCTPMTIFAPSFPVHVMHTCPFQVVELGKLLRGQISGDEDFVYLDSVIHKWNFIRIWLRMSQAYNSAPTSECVGSDRRGCDNSLCFCFAEVFSFFLSCSKLRRGSLGGLRTAKVEGVFISLCYSYQNG